MSANIEATAATAEGDVTSSARLHLRPPIVLRVLGIVTGLSLAAATAIGAPSASGVLDYSLSGDNRTTSAMAAIMITLPVAGCLFGATWMRFGLGAGSALVTAGWAMCVVGVTLRDAQDAIAAADRGALGVVVSGSAAMAAGVITFVLAAASQRRLDPTLRVPGASWILGVASSATLVVGLMLPAGDAPGSFVDRNLPVDDSSNVAWLALVAAFGTVGIVGFASRSQFGLAAVAASLVPLAWMMAVYRLGLDYSGEDGVTLVKSFEVHHLVLFAACGQSLALVLGGLAATRAANPTWRVF